jgi:Protein of unknown function (DUF3054)
MTRRWWLAPTLDLVCIVTFILVGAGRHNINDGADWFLMVLWPLVVGWYGVALATRLYFSDDHPWLRLTITLAVGTLIASLLRGGFTDRPTFSIFTVVFVAWMLLTAYGWRLVGRFFSARRGRSAPAASA